MCSCSCVLLMFIFLGHFIHSCNVYYYCHDTWTEKPCLVWSSKRNKWWWWIRSPNLRYFPLCSMNIIQRFSIFCFGSSSNFPFFSYYEVLMSLNWPWGFSSDYEEIWSWSSQSYGSLHFSCMKQIIHIPIDIINTTESFFGRTCDTFAIQTHHFAATHSLFSDTDRFVYSTFHPLEKQRYLNQL